MICKNQYLTLLLECGQPGDEILRPEDHMRGAVAVWCLPARVVEATGGYERAMWMPRHRLHCR